MIDDDLDAISEAEFDAAFAAVEPAEIVRDQHIRAETDDRSLT